MFVTNPILCVLDNKLPSNTDSISNIIEYYSLNRFRVKLNEKIYNVRNRKVDCVIDIREKKAIFFQ